MPNSFYLIADEELVFRVSGRADTDSIFSRGKIKLADREVKVKRPHLRHKSEGEVKIPGYEKLRRDRGLQQQSWAR